MHNLICTQKETMLGVIPGHDAPAAVGGVSVAAGFEQPNRIRAIWALVMELVEATQGRRP